MSKRTLDAFLVAPAANAKKAKITPDAGSPSSSRNISKRKAIGLEVIEVVDLDEVIDLSSPPPQPHDTLVYGKTGAKPERAEARVDESIQSGSREGDEHPIPVLEPDNTTTPRPKEMHQSYPFPIPRLSPTVSRAISASPIKEPKVLNHLPHLDLLTFEPYLGSKDAREYGEFLRRELPFYRVEYKLTRFGKETDIKTPRFTVSLPPPLFLNATDAMRPC